MAQNEEIVISYTTLSGGPAVGLFRGRRGNLHARFIFGSNFMI
jgi:hypothetical protein